MYYKWDRCVEHSLALLTRTRYSKKPETILRLSTPMVAMDIKKLSLYI